MFRKAKAVRAIMPNMAQSQMDILTSNVVSQVAKTTYAEMNKKYHEDFDKIAEELKNMAKYINSLEEKVMQLEKKIKTNQDGELQSEDRPRTD